MKFPRRTFLHLAVGAAALPAVPAHCAGASLSVTAGAHRRRLSRRRGDRHPGAPDGSMAVGAPRPAIHHREPRRRQRQHRHRGGRQGTRGWLHAAAGRDPACDQCRALQQSQFRLHPGHRAGHLRSRGWPTSSWCIRRSPPRRSPSSSPTPRPTRARSTTGRPAPARRKTLPANSSR